MNYRRFPLWVACACGLCLFFGACVQKEKLDHFSADKLPFGEVLEPSEDVPVTGPFAIRGWAVSENGIEQVAIYEDRKFLANATLGLASAEAQKAAPGIPGSATAGWRFDADPGMFTGATHEFTVQARSKTGAVRELGSLTVVIGTPYGKVDEPVDGAEVARSFWIRGWAISEHGVDRVTILADGKLLGTSQFGRERPDVKGVFPKAKNNLLCGWRFEVTPAMLAPGEHEIVARVHSRHGIVRDLDKVKVRVRK